MNAKNKIIIFVVSILTTMFLFLLFNITYSFKEYGIKSIDNNAQALALTIRHSLTSQMLSGAIKDRELFLAQLEDIPNINKIWLSRSDAVIKEYGKGDNNEIPRDDIDKQVLKTGKIMKVINDNLFSKSSYRITIPYLASSKGKINCISCHQGAKEGEPLGAISMEISIDQVKDMGISILSNTILVLAFLIILVIILINILITPFLNLLGSIKTAMNKAQNGDYSHRITNSKGKELKEVASWINDLLEKLEETLDAIDNKISIFLSHNKSVKKDRLLNVKNTIDRLSDIYKFRKTIEHDKTLEEIYKRLANVLKKRLGLKDFNIFEADTMNESVSSVFVENKLYCNVLETGCRADRTNTIVDSKQFKDICSSCENNNPDFNYFCIPYSISNELDLIISINTNNKEENTKIREVVPYIADYVDAAKTVIVSKKLMKVLENNAQTDSLTGLYNRKYLDYSIPKIQHQINRANILFGLLLIDIDHFKEVNDTHGHDIGDEVIKIVSKTLIENIRNSDVVIRYGGEEFLVLLYNCDSSFILQVSNKIKDSLQNKKIPVGNTYIQKTISIGTSLYPQDNENFTTCIKYADLALYKAKNTGRNKIVSFSDKLLS